MSKAAVVSNANVLESLPPVVPSIGWRKPKTIDEGGNNENQTNSSQQSTTQPESSQTPESNNNDTVTSPIKNIPSAVKVGNRTVITSKPPRQWAWKSFTSSARHDSAQFFHWVRANVEYADYPYARFDVHLDALTYTDEEYQKHLAMSEVQDLGETLPDFLTVANQIKMGGEGKETKTDNAGAEESLLQQQLLQSNKILPWTKAETDVLMDLCQKYDLRWPVIIDRWHMRFEEGTVSSLRKVEDLQYRYYQVGSILAQKRVVAEATKLSVASTSGVDVPPAKDTAADTTVAEASNGQPTASTAQKPLDQPDSAAPESALKLSSAAPASFPGTGTSSRGKMFDLVAERARRRQLDYVWNQSQEEAQEEAALRAELRAVEAQLRKLKKTGKHLVTSGSAQAPPPTKKPSTSSTVNPAPASDRHTAAVVSAPVVVDPFFHAHQEVDASFKETAPVPTPGTPYLQSGRLFPPNIEGHSKLKKSTLKQMDEILSELGVPKEPIATKRSCDLFDGVRKDAMTLLILQKMALKKEAELAEKRAKLEKRTMRAASTTNAQEKKDDQVATTKDPKPAEKVEETSQNTGAAEAPTTEKASKKKRKNPPSSTTAAPVVSQPASTAAAPVATQSTAAVPVTSSDPTATASAPVPHAATSSSLISQGKTTKAAAKKRARKK